MLSVQIISLNISQRNKPMSRCCCFGAKKSNSNPSIEADFNEPYEYVVEKLVIKRVPVKRFSASTNLKIITSHPPTSKELLKDVTFSSYCQVGPMEVSNKKQLPLPLTDAGDDIKGLTSRGGLGIDEQAFAVLGDICGEGDLANGGADSPREEMTSGRREQLQQCVKNLNTAQVYKHATASPRLSAKRKTAAENKVLFTKPMPAREIEAKEVPPAVKETMDILATKQPMSTMNRRLVNRDPDTGQIKEIFQNVKIEKPVKLDEIYPQKEALSSDKKRPKWKIIIRHRNDKAKQKIEESSSSLGMETDI